MISSVPVGLNGNDATAKHAAQSVATPKIAAVLLEKADKRNSQNLIRLELIQEVADWIRAESVLNCLPLKFENAGCIQDGAHRLHTVVQRERRMPLCARSARNDMKPKKLLLAGDQHGSPGLKPGRTKAYHRLPSHRVCLQNRTFKPDY
jgi:hypothetical protein